MNENAEKSEAMPSGPAKILSGNSLLQIHINAGKSLPKDGPKDFAPSNSWMEKKQIQSALDERKELLEEERVEKWGFLATAVWNDNKKVAEVTRRTGKHFQTLGFEKDGALYLYPEEALYLLETNSLELSFGGVPVSIQQGYSLLLGPNSGCKLIEYRAYSHLLRQGYRLLRFSNHKLHTKYERMIRLDQHVPVKRRRAAPACVNQSQLHSNNLKNPGGVKSEALCLEGTEQDSVENCIKQEFRGNRKYHNDDPTSIEAIGYDVETYEDSALDHSEQNSHPLKKENTVSQEQAAEKKRDEVRDEQLCQESAFSEDLEDNNKDEITSKQLFCENLGNKSIAHSNKEETTNELCPNFGTEVVGDVNRGDSVGGQVCQSNSGTGPIKSPSSSKDRNVLSEVSSGLCQGKVDSHEKSIVPENGHDSMEICDVETDQTGQLQKNSESNLLSTIGEDNCSPHVEGAQTKAYGIAESLLSLGNVLVGKDTNNSGCGSKAEDLSVTLQSEIIKILGDHIESDVSKEALIAVASSAATTILSHMSGKQDGKTDTNQKIFDRNVADEAFDDNSCHDSEENSVVSPIQEGTSRNESLGEPSTSSLNSDFSATEKNENFVANNDVKTSELLSLKQHTASEKSSLKRPASSNEECEPILTKRARSGNVSDSEIEILDASPEARHVELVNLSDESSVESVIHSKADNDSIEVIDVNDSSTSSECNESDDSSSESSDSVIVECEGKSPAHWESDRKNILDTIPNMYRLTEISLVPPSSDLLPPNVQPQRNRYIISRKKLLEDREEAIHRLPSIQRHEVMVHEENRESNTSQYGDWAPPRRQYIRHMEQQPQPTYDFDSPDCQPQQVWQPNGQMNPIAAVQAIAQLVLPMLGLSQAPFQGDQMWMPSNTWFPSQSNWGPSQGPRFHQQNFRGSNWQRPYRPRPYGYRPRYNHRSRGRNYSHYSNSNQRGTSAESVALPRNNEIVPFQSTSHGRSGDHVGGAGQNQPRCWMQQHVPWRRGKGRQPYKGPRRRSRYYSHLHKHLKEENCEVLSIKSDETSFSSEPNNGSSVKAESYFSDEDNSSEAEDVKDFSLNDNSNSSLHEGTQSTDESCNSPLEVKPLLSPSDCTNFENVFRTIRIIKEVDTETLMSTVGNKLLKPQFDLFSPNKPFKKGNPPLPDFHLCIMDFKEPVPGPQEIKALVTALDDKVSVMFAIVSPDSISFIELPDVSLPTLVSGSV
ncbi:hypothetical protein ONE63_008789 [Megalurothrips usitatus]|uniref:tRNA-splicing endonuclease subunit Sen54 N-terminal domain-containing protein n=1 Tax=Megalurothrips usitatus TaxID=439358 RepID=A0AAV7XV12_9NEOP|nr:hypothetical protein ONE63_008789 [Megalurothrips usitatus]